MILSWLLPAGGPSVRDRLLSWDAGWFLRVAEGYPHGFTYNDSGQMVGNGLAFFPLYPALIRVGHVLGLEPGTAALTVSWITGAIAAVLIAELGTRLYARRVGYLLVVLCFTQPMAIVFSMAYTESLFVALVAGMLLAAHRRAFLVAGLLGLGASLTRPTGLAAALALAVACALYLRERYRRRRAGALDAGRDMAPDGPDLGSDAPWPAPWRPVAGALIALVGVPGYLAWVGLRVGEPAAWFRIQTAGWGTSFDYGHAVWRFLVDAFQRGQGW